VNFLTAHNKTIACFVFNEIEFIKISVVLWEIISGL